MHIELSEDWRAACVSLPVRRDFSAFAGCDGQECPSCGMAFYRWADAAPLAVPDALPPGANQRQSQKVSATVLNNVNDRFERSHKRCQEPFIDKRRPF